MLTLNDKGKQFDALWAHRDFDGLRKAGCTRNAETGCWEFWEDREPARLDDAIVRVLTWTSKGRP
jgi:hypothetical protein